MVNINNISSNVLEDLVFSKDELEELKRARKVLFYVQKCGLAI